MSNHVRSFCREQEIIRLAGLLIKRGLWGGGAFNPVKGLERTVNVLHSGSNVSESKMLYYVVKYDETSEIQLEVVSVNSLYSKTFRKGNGFV